MNRQIILLSLLLFGFTACDVKEASPVSYELKTLKEFKLSPLADSIFTAYVQKHPAAPAYVIFIDKKSEGMDNYHITIAHFSRKLGNLYESGAINYFMLNDSTPVFIYTGLEDFVSTDTPSFPKQRELATLKNMGEFKHTAAYKSKIDFSQSLSYIHSDTSSYIVEGDNFPFSILTIKPTVYFKAPK